MFIVSLCVSSTKFCLDTFRLHNGYGVPIHVWAGQSSQYQSYIEVNGVGGPPFGLPLSFGLRNN